MGRRHHRCARAESERRQQLVDTRQSDQGDQDRRGDFVDGTPTDCVHLALTGLLVEEPDVVVAGVNAGANLGDDVIYSGTVAAAMEGRFLGLPAVAISLVLDRGRHFDTAARVARILLSDIAGSPIPTDTIFNVNVPDIPFEDLRVSR